MYRTGEHEGRGAHEVLFSGSSEKLALGERLRTKLLEKVGLAKEVNDKIDTRTTENVNAIITVMEQRLAEAQQRDSGADEAELKWELFGEEGNDLPMTAIAMYRPSEEGKTLAIDISPGIGPIQSERSENDVGYGTTVFHRAEDGHYLVDLNYDGRMAPLKDISVIDKLALAPLTEGLARVAESDQAHITTNSHF